MRLVFLGPPGVGKGTQARRVCTHRRIVHISTGDMLRESIRKGTPIGVRAQGYMDRGELVPDQIMIDLIRDRLQKPDAARGFLLDGFPRTTEQAKALDLMLTAMEMTLDVTVAFTCSRQRIIERLSGRRTCPKCAAVFHLTYAPPRAMGRCDHCGAGLIQREDDRPEAVSQRLDVYEHQTAPLLHYYRERDLLQEVPAEGDVDAIAHDLDARLGPSTVRRRRPKARAATRRRPARTAARRTRRRPARSARRRSRR